MPAISFDISHTADWCDARVGRVVTPHGSFDTPAFMPVGTQGAIKGLLPESVAGTGAQIVLANTYHLLLRPGSELVAAMGGLQKWSGWGGPMLTDSGGFQVYSLGDINAIDDEGVMFKSHLDGAMVQMTPASSMRVQNELGADIIMAFDDCPPAAAPSEHQQQRAAMRAVRDGDGEDDRTCGTGGRAGAGAGQAASGTGQARSGTAGVPMLSGAAYRERVRIACERSCRWLGECVAAHGRKDEQALFGIVQGGTDLDQRAWCVDAVCSHDLAGYAIGGVAVGEGPEELRKVVAFTAPRLPANRPRYLMGVGYERDIWSAVQAGVDMFDCVLPTRNGRNGNAFTPTGQVRLRNAKYARDGSAIDAGCDCPACRGGVDGGGFSRSYLRHLFAAGEMLGPILVSLHNLRHFQRLLLDIRRAITDNDQSLIARRWPVAIQTGG